MIYLDYNASVPLRPEAKEALIRALESMGNPSSPHAFGRKNKALIEDARHEILKAIEAPKLIFTSGGTEANALALSGFGKGPVVVSSIEHDSVLKGTLRPTLLPVLRNGYIDLEKLESLLEDFPKPGLLSVMLVNNETGIIQPVKKAAEMAQAKGWKVHTDASQALGNLPLSFHELGVDMMTLSSHKCGGPLGVGALVMKEEIQLTPLIRGGGQEFGMRAGTLATPLISGFSSALNSACEEQPLASQRLKVFQDTLIQSLPEAVVYGKGSLRSSQVVCLGMPGVSAELQLMAFDLRRIAVSAGSACSSGKMKPSHVLSAMGISPGGAKCAIRLSMGWKTHLQEIQLFIDAWKEIYSQKEIKEAS